MFYGMKFYNDLLMEAGPFGNVQTEILLKKDKDTFTLKQGWAFPRKIYFNGDECQLPPPDAYPILPNSAHKKLISFFRIAGSMVLLIVLVWLPIFGIINWFFLEILIAEIAVLSWMVLSGRDLWFWKMVVKDIFRFVFYLLVLYVIILW